MNTHIYDFFFFFINFYLFVLVINVNNALQYNPLWIIENNKEQKTNKHKIQSSRTEPVYNYIESSLSLYNNHFSHLLANRCSFTFNLYVRCSIACISSIIDIHCLLQGGSVLSQFLVMAFFPATKRILIRYWSPICTDPSKCPRYRTRQDLGITYPSTLQRTE